MLTVVMTKVQPTSVDSRRLSWGIRSAFKGEYIVMASVTIVNQCQCVLNASRATSSSLSQALIFVRGHPFKVWLPVPRTKTDRYALCCPFCCSLRSFMLSSCLVLKKPFLRALSLKSTMRPRSVRAVTLIGLSRARPGRRGWSIVVIRICVCRRSSLLLRGYGRRRG